MSTTSTTGPAHRASSYSNVPNVQVSAANDIDYVYRDTPLVAARSSPGGGGQSTSSRSPGPTRARFEHIGYVLKGRMALRMDDGTEREFGPGETIHMPPGHDAWIVGDEACVLLGDQSWHGDGGPLPITRYLALELTEIAAAGMQALEAVGFPVVEDHNRPGAVGAHEDDSQGRATPLLASASRDCGRPTPPAAHSRRTSSERPLARDWARHTAGRRPLLSPAGSAGDRCEGSTRVLL